MHLNLKLALLMLVAASCSHDENESVNNQISDGNSLVPVTVQVKDFSISVEEMSDMSTRTAVDAVDYSSLKALTLAFYSGDTEVSKTTQLRGDNTTYTTFGEFTSSLPMGDYTMVVIGYGYQDGDELTLTSPTSAAFTAGRVRETFVKTQDVAVHNDTAINLSVTLDRIVSRLDIASTDTRTANATSVRATFSKGGKDFSPTTGLAITNTGFSNTVTIGKAVGEATTTASSLFLSADEQTMDVTIETLDTDGNVLFSEVVSNVPFKRNRKTVLSGKIYSDDVNSAFKLNTDWITSAEMDF